MNIELKYKLNGEHRVLKGLENEDAQLEVIKADNRTTIILHPKKNIELVNASIKVDYVFDSTSKIFLNGYQSWTETREFELNEKVHNMNRLPKKLKEMFHFENYGDAWFYKYDKNCFHGYTYCYVKDKDDHASFTGSLNEENAYMIIHYNKKDNIICLESDCEYKRPEGDFKLFDFVHYEGYVRDVLNRYFSHFGPCTAPPVRGYTSWYNHYQDINEEKMLIALKGINNEQFDLFQIDDGYETFVGDWLDVDPVKFPNGLRPIVEKIHSKGLKAGIWLAPFVCETNSRLYDEHPDWLFRKNGNPVFAGSNWSGDVALDIRKKEVQDYIRKCLEYYMDLGFDFFKLDFLYAACLVMDDEPFTRAEIMRKAMVGLREILKDKLILGCGVPLSSAFGLVDYCRIGPDVSLKFDDVFYMKFMHRERISTKTTLLNTIFRYEMDGHVFRCDPDVFLLRDDNIDLSPEQKKALVTINHLCGSVYMTSDNVKIYTEDKFKILQEARALCGAKIEDVHKDGYIYTVKYVVNGNHGVLKYNSKKGVLV
ncbi:MAG: alpha-galactosidase [Lachnospiraceae bacterium]|nr:alpha-galactosidase [Lachnospiraceae bacterium]